MKTLLLILMLTLGMSLSAQEHYLQATSIAITAGEEIESFSSDVKMVLNLQTKKCIIYSSKTQIIDYVVERVFTDEDGYSVLECLATDTDYKDISFAILVHPTKNIILIRILYRDLGYMYRCHAVSGF